jgi:type IV secretion system protein VirB6
MNGAFQIFQPANQFIDAKLDAFLGERLQSVLSAVAGPIHAALALYVLLYGVAILRGAINEPIMDFAVRSLKLAFISLIATTPAYGDWVTIPLFHIAPDALTQAVSGQASGDPGAAFDAFFARAAYLGERIGQSPGIMLSPMVFLPGAVVIIGACAAAMGFGLTMLAKVALALIIALGPIFIGCALFDASRRFFFGWLSQAVNYLLLLALMITVFQLIIGLIDAQWGELDTMDPLASGALFIALCVLAVIFFFQIPGLASGIAGGASAGLGDFWNAGRNASALLSARRGTNPAPEAAQAAR